MSLNKMRYKIGKMVKQKGFGNNYCFIPFKLFYTVLEISEVGEMWKKGKNKWQNGKWKNKTKEEWELKLAEELIDVIFYVLDVSRLLCPNIKMDNVFEEKLKKNLNRPFQYGLDDAYKEMLKRAK